MRKDQIKKMHSLMCKKSISKFILSSHSKSLFKSPSNFKELRKLGVIYISLALMYNKNALNYINDKLKMPINKKECSIFLSNHVLTKRKIHNNPELLEIDYCNKEKFRSGEFDKKK